LKNTRGKACPRTGDPLRPTLIFVYSCPHRAARGDDEQKSFQSGKCMETKAGFAKPEDGKKYKMGYQKSSSLSGKTPLDCFVESLIERADLLPNSASRVVFTFVPAPLKFFRLELAFCIW